MAIREEDIPDSVFDDRVAEQLIGKYVLIGFTYVDEQGKDAAHIQMHGSVQSAHRSKGIAVALKGNFDGDRHVLPPCTASFHEAEPGEYRLRTTGEVIVDPDYISTWRYGPGLRENGSLIKKSIESETEANRTDDGT